MINQTVYLNKILPEFKQAGVTATEIEKHLGLSTGYLSKVKTGKRTLEEDNITKLQDFHKEKVSEPKEQKVPIFIIESSVPSTISEIIHKKSKSTPIEIKQAPVKLQMPKGLNLIQQLDWREKYIGR